MFVVVFVYYFPLQGGSPVPRGGETGPALASHSPAHALSPHAMDVLLRGVNALQFQIASHSSTAISTFRTTPPPAVSAPGPLQFQGVAGATVPPPTSPFRLRARRGNAVFRAGLQAPEVHQAPISVTAGGSSLSQLPTKKM